MKKLYIMRHAKSSWKNLDIDDFDRPLNKRGKRDLLLMGEVLKHKHFKPDIIFSSPALRAKITAKSIANSLEYTNTIVYKEDIYEACIGTLKKIIENVNNQYHSIMLFGHNPSFNTLAYDYVGFEENIPTSGVIEIEFSCAKWSQVNTTNAKLVSFEYPKKGYRF